jgi:C1A family cysteine protease
VDLRAWSSPVEDQYDLGSCTGSAITSAYELLTKLKQPEKFVELSRLFVYYNIRLIEGTTDIDSGAYIRDGIKALKKYGVCKEELWPYKTNEFATPPPQSCYEEARQRSITNYRRLSGVNDILDALNNNQPVMFGMAVYEGFMDISYRYPTISLPDYNESSLGGHAMLMVGYDLKRKVFLAQNSFGVDWGLYGYCWMPFDYVRQEVYDVWTFDLSDRTDPAAEFSF